MKKKRYEAEGAKEYREANRRIQKAVKKAKEDWIGAQCEEIETCLNKNNSKRAYGIDVAEPHSANGIQREIKVKGQKLGTVTSFKYLGAVVSDDGSKPEVLSRIAQATAALTKLKPIWRDNNIKGEADALPCHFHISVCL